MDDLAGRNILITGANTGIGRATAVALARRGASLVLACRSEEKTQPVIAECGGQATFLPLDLASLASIRAAAARFLESARPLHVLINNAGLAGQRGTTDDGFELAFGVNHLGHFLLTNLLLARLQESSPARIVNVSSRGHYAPKTIDFTALRRSTRTMAGLEEYNVSKLCNVLFTQRLAERMGGSGVTVYALHPGVIASDVWRRIPWPLRSLATAFMGSTEDGARTSIYCSVDPGVANDSGLYYDGCRARPASRWATPELGERLWQESVAWSSEKEG